MFLKIIFRYKLHIEKKGKSLWTGDTRTQTKVLSCLRILVVSMPDLKKHARSRNGYLSFYFTQLPIFYNTPTQRSTSPPIPTY